MGDFRIETVRLTLREWREEDASAMHAMGQDRRVMRYLGSLTDRAEAEKLVRGQAFNHSLFGHCFWPIEIREDRRMIGFCGLQPGPKDTPLEDEIEIGWRLAHDHWGQGYAREAAEACLAWGWANLACARIGAITVPANRASWGLMERLGMRRDPAADFDHPKLAEDDPLARHITYWIDRPQA